MQLFSADSILEVLYCNKFWKFCFCTRLNKLKTSNRINIVTSDKVQLISKCLLGVIVSTKKTKIFWSISTQASRKNYTNYVK